MRRDMPKVVVERPRTGWRISFSERRHRFEHEARTRDDERDLPSLMPMGFAGTKALNENLAPLRRFLASRCGRRWNDVYAELRRFLAPRNAVDMHVMQHLWDYVLFARPDATGALSLVHHDGQERGRLRDGRFSGTWRPMLFYVCSESGRLERIAHRRKRSRR